MLNKIVRCLFIATFIMMGIVTAHGGNMMLGVISAAVAMYFVVFDRIEIIPKDLGEESDEEEES